MIPSQGLFLATLLACSKKQTFEKNSLTNPTVKVKIKKKKTMAMVMTTAMTTTATTELE